MSKEEIEQLFDNNFDCYADTWDTDETDATLMIEGEVVLAMTREKFSSLVFALLNTEN